MSTIDKTENKNKRIPRPEWLKIKPPGGSNHVEIKKMMRTKTLHTVCEEARCPNLAECWHSGTATFMILGDVCVRSCQFCAIATSKPLAVDPHEPQKVAESIKQMDIKHAVITSVNRDELPDQGSKIWAETIRKTRELNPEVSVEVLIPDFKGDMECLQRVFDEKPDVLNHNMETVPRLYRTIRPQAKYETSLYVLEQSKKQGLRTKTGVKVGLGETTEEILEVMKDLREIDVDIVTIGQYLQASKELHPVIKYYHPDEFNYFRRKGLNMGFDIVESGPLVRSSYHAHKHI